MAVTFTHLDLPGELEIRRANLGEDSFMPLRFLMNLPASKCTIR